MRVRSIQLIFLGAQLYLLVGITSDRVAQASEPELLVSQRTDANRHTNRPHMTMKTGEAKKVKKTKLKAGIKAAKALFYSGQARAAALAFDAIYAEYLLPQSAPPTKLLHLAALAWASANDDTRAILRWRRYVAMLEASKDDDFDIALAYLQEAYKRTAEVNLAVEPTGAYVDHSHIELLQLSRVPSGSSSSSKTKETFQAIRLGPQQALLASGALRLFLSPGRWRITLLDLHPGYAPSSIEIEIHGSLASEPRTPSLALSRKEGTLEISQIPPRQHRTNDVGTRFLHLEDAAGIEANRKLLLPAEGTLRLPLRSGSWRYHVEDSRGATVAHGEFELGANTDRHLNLNLDAPAGKPRPLDNPRLHLSRGLGISGATLGLAGLGLVVPSAYMLRSDGPRVESAVPPGLRGLINRDACTPLPTNEPLAAGFSTQNDLQKQGLRRECVVSKSLFLGPLGASLLGASLGLTSHAILVRTSVQARYFAIPGTIGLISVGISTVLVTRSYRQIYGGHTTEAEAPKNGLNDPQGASWDVDITVADDVLNQASRLSLASGLLGLGGGLLVGAASVFLSPLARPHRRRTSTSTAFGPRANYKVAGQHRQITITPTFGGGSLRVDF